jgi:hypothetical protein
MIFLLLNLTSCTLPDPLPTAVSTYELSCDAIICHDPAAIGWYGGDKVVCEWACVESSKEEGILVYASYTFSTNSETGCIEISYYWEDKENDRCREW